MTFINNPKMKVKLCRKAKKRVNHFRSAVNKWVTKDKKVIYGVTTGLGKLKDSVINLEQQNEFQQNILLSHAVGLGPLFPRQIVRLAMLLRANVLARGHSSVRSELIERIILFINHHLYPHVPQVGSLGVGDLQPMAHIGLCLTGTKEGMMSYKEEEGNSEDILRKAGITPVNFPLEAKEALSLISGSTMVLAMTIYNHYQANQLCDIANMAAALNMEASRGKITALDQRIHQANNLQTEQRIAKFILNMLKNSEWTTDIGRKRLKENDPRVQDAVSIRSTVQVHGAIKDILNYIKTILEKEINASTDNPLIFYDGEQFESLSGGNFHGAHLAYAADFISIVLTDLAVISERRSARLLDFKMGYGLATNLIPDAGLNTGLALLHANATALVGEMKILATPASIESIPVKGNQEDHNSMGLGAARKTRQIAHYTKKVLVIELMLAAQAIDLITEKMIGLSLGNGTDKLHQWIRKFVKPVWKDRLILQDLEKLLTEIENGRILSLSDDI